MFSKYDEECKKILVNMQKEKILLKHPYIGSEHLFLSILKYGNVDLRKKLFSYGITYDFFRRELIKVVGIGKKESSYILYTPLLREILENCSTIAIDENKDLIQSSDLIYSLLNSGDGVAIRILMGMNINIDNLYDDFSSFVDNSKPEKTIIETFGIDLCERAKKNDFDPVIARDSEIQRLIEILIRRNKNNPLLVGDAGVGKTAIVEELARLISIGNVPDCLKSCKIISVSMANLVAGTKYRGEFEERFEKILREIRSNKNIILFIDEIHTLVGAGGAEGAIDASNILKPALARGDIKLIGATTYNEYKLSIQKDKALARRFQMLFINEPSKEETLNILKKLKPLYEKYHKVKISDDVLSLIVFLSDQFIYDRKMPDKAIDVMDEVLSKVSLNKCRKKSNLINISNQIIEIQNKKNNYIKNNYFEEALLCKKEEMNLISKKNKLEIKQINSVNYLNASENDVYCVINEMSNLPFFNQNKVNSLNIIKTKLNNSIVGQSVIVNKIYELTKKIRYGLKNNNPYSVLFVGPKGVGKTLFASFYAKYCYNNNIIKLNMSEYTEDISINKIVGSPPGYIGYDDNKNLCSFVKDNPYCVILFDEIEFANKKIFNLLLQILETGFIKDSSGNDVCFNNSFLIFTSNIYNNSKIGFNCDYKYTDFINYFDSNFINKITDILLFDKLSFENIFTIVQKKLIAVKKNYSDLNIRFGRKVILDIIDFSKYQDDGAKNIDNVVSKYVDSIILEYKLHGKKNLYIKELKNESCCYIH